jgi:DNA transformation protein
MATDSGLIEHLRELLEPMPGVSFKRMFGGYGIFRHDLMFALISDDTLYLKVDEQNKAAFEERGLGPFVYLKAGKPMPMSYYRAPDETLDDTDEMVAWAEQAYAAAVRAQTAKPKTKKAAKTPST